LMIRDKSHPLRIEEIPVGPESRIKDHTLREADLRRDTDALVIAVYNSATGRHTYNPPPNFTVRDKHVLLVLGTLEEIEHLRRHIT
ncbi:MAG: TrkA C-terminal domain-containing protein, partial [Myxococcota bacterium]